MEERMKRQKRKFYHFKEFSTKHLILYPLMVLCWYCHRLKVRVTGLIYSFYIWDEKRAHRIITACIIRRGELEEGNIYFRRRTWGTYWSDKYNCGLRDRLFCRKFNIELTNYLLNDYQIEGYTKTVDKEDDSYNFTFKKEEN